MKMNFVCAFIAASACSAFLISSANAGGQRHALGLSSSATTSTTATSTGRSPLGEPVFLIPSTTSSSSSSSISTSSGGGGRERIQHVSPAREAVHLMDKSSTGVATNDRGTKIIFTPPPTIVGVSPSVTGTGNIAGNNLADRTFGGSILGTGLGSKSSNPSPAFQQVSASQGNLIPSTVPVGAGPQGPPSLTPWIRITPLQYNGPTVEVPTASSISRTSSSTTAGH